MKQLTLVVPVRSRIPALRKMIDSLRAQTLPAGLWDLLLVQNGAAPQDDADIARILAGVPFRARRIIVEPRGPAFARNRGVESAEGDVILLLNSDVILDEGHLQAHHDFHLRQPDIHRAAHSTIRWHPEVIRGSHMKALASSAHLYDVDYPDFERPWVWCCTASLSIKRKLLIENPFDESFPEASFEDTELGHRLARLGEFTIDLLDDHPAYHWHYHTRSDYLRRAAMNGRNAVRLLARAPELRERLIGVFENPPPRRRLLSAAAAALSADGERFWRELEKAVYTRAFWKDAAALSGQ